MGRQAHDLRLLRDAPAGRLQGLQAQRHDGQPDQAGHLAAQERGGRGSPREGARGNRHRDTRPAGLRHRCRLRVGQGRDQAQEGSGRQADGGSRRVQRHVADRPARRHGRRRRHDRLGGCEPADRGTVHLLYPRQRCVVGRGQTGRADRHAGDYSRPRWGIGHARIHSHLDERDGPPPRHVHRDAVRLAEGRQLRAGPQAVHA